MHGRYFFSTIFSDLVSGFSSFSFFFFFYSPSQQSVSQENSPRNPPQKHECLFPVVHSGESLYKWIKEIETSLRSKWQIFSLSVVIYFSVNARRASSCCLGFSQNKNKKQKYAEKGFKCPKCFYVTNTFSKKKTFMAFLQSWSPPELGFFFLRIWTPVKTSLLMTF